jgi:hypothetical protein
MGKETEELLKEQLEEMKRQNEQLEGMRKQKEKEETRGKARYWSNLIGCVVFVIIGLCVLMMIWAN